MPFDFFFFYFSVLEFIDSSRRKVTVDHQTSSSHTTLSPVDGPVALETTYLITSPDDDSSLNNKRVRFIVQKPNMNGHSLTTMRTNGVSVGRPRLSLVEAVNSKYLDLSTGMFSSSLPFVLSSSSQTNSIENNKNPPSSLLTPTDTQTGTTTTTTSTTITLKEAIDANILDAHSAYVVDTLEQR